MSKFRLDISVSLDGFVSGPNVRPDLGLGEGGEQLHEWAVRTEGWRERHDREGGEAGADSELVEEMSAGVGAAVMGRNMFGGGGAPWGDPTWGDGAWEGWWGDEPPFGYPVFVLTHHEREPLVKGKTTFTFVTDGIESALEQARAAAGDHDVSLGGGASVANQYLRAGLLDEVQIHVVPVFLGDGARLFDGLGDADVKLETTRVLESPTGVTHIKYRVRN